MLWHKYSCFNVFINMFNHMLSTDERGSSWRRFCRCRLHQSLPWWQPLVRPAAMESLPWLQPFLSFIECMCDLPMYGMYILSYIVLSQKWLNKDDQTDILFLRISRRCLRCMKKTRYFNSVSIDRAYHLRPNRRTKFYRLIPAFRPWPSAVFGFMNPDLL